MRLCVFSCRTGFTRVLDVLQQDDDNGRPVFDDALLQSLAGNAFASTIIASLIAALYSVVEEKPPQPTEAEIALSEACADAMAE